MLADQSAANERESRKDAESSEERRRRQLYVSDCSRAFQLLKDGNVELVHELLNRQISKAEQLDLRGPEWYYLRRECDKNLNVPTFKLNSLLSDSDVSEDGQMLAAIGENSLLAVWSVTDGQQIRRLQVPREQLSNPNTLNIVRFSMDGKFLAAIMSGFYRVWDVENWELETEIALTEEMYAAAISPDLRLLAYSPRQERSIKLIETSVQDGNAETISESGSLNCLALEFSPKGNFLCWCRGSESAIWSTTENRISFTIENRGGWSYAAAFSDDERYLACHVGGPPHLVNVYDITRKSKEPIETFHGNTAHVRTIAASIDNAYVATGGDETNVRIWKISQPDQLHAIKKGHSAIIRKIQFLRNSNDILVSSYDGIIRKWALDEEVSTIDDHLGSRFPVGLQFSRDGSVIQLICRHKKNRDANAEVHHWDVRDGKQTDGEQAQFETDPRSNRDPFLSPDRRYRILPAGVNVDLIDAISNQKISTLAGHRTPPNDWAYSPDSRTLATLDGPDVKLWNLLTGEEITTIHTESLLYAVTYSSDGTLAVANDYCMVQIFRTKSH